VSIPWPTPPYPAPPGVSPEVHARFWAVVRRATLNSALPDEVFAAAPVDATEALDDEAEGEPSEVVDAGRTRGYSTDHMVDSGIAWVALCACGCGRPAPIARETSSRRGYVKGQPMWFIHGHHGRRAMADRLWEKVDRSGGPLACWPWTGCRDRNGYGQIGVAGRMVKAHRIAWILTHGPIPPETPHVRHVVCRNHRVATRPISSRAPRPTTVKTWWPMARLAAASSTATPN
jgi:hypothetical protein